MAAVNEKTKMTETVELNDNSLDNVVAGKDDSRYAVDDVVIFNYIANKGTDSSSVIIKRGRIVGVNGNIYKIEADGRTHKIEEKYIIGIITQKVDNGAHGGW